MRILILTQWYPPEPALLLQELAQSLQGLGHEVTVLTGFPNYPSGQLYPGYKIRLRRREVLEGVPVVRVPLYPEHSRSGLRRALNYISFALSAALLGPWLSKRPNVIFVYHPPLTVGLPAWVLSRIWRVPFVYQIQDIWPETLAATGMLNSPRALNMVGAVARWVYRKAAALLVISPGFKENLVGKGVTESKIHIIPNWANAETYRPRLPDLALAEELGMAGKFNVLFAGNIGEAQALDTVVQAATYLTADPEVQFVIVGDGTALEDLKQAAIGRGLTNMRFLGRRPAAEMPSLYALADVLLVHLRDDPLFRITVPHKIMAYMASGKPILAAVAGDAADVVQQAGAGLTCPPQEPASLAEAVRVLQALSPGERRAMGERARQAAEGQYGREETVRRIEGVLISTVSSRV